MIIFLIVFLWAFCAEAATYHVGKNISGASDSHNCTNNTSQVCLTISKGISVMSGGDTLLIYSGTYAEVITGSQLAGKNGGGSYATATVIAAAPGSERLVTLAPSAGPTAILDLYNNLQWFILRGLVIDGAGGVPIGAYSPNAGGDNTVNIKLENNEIKNTQHGVLGWKNSWITGNTVHDSADTPVREHCFYISRGGNLIEYNELYNCRDGWGIHIYDTGSSTVSDNIVRFNRVHDIPNQSGIMISHGTNNQVYNNLVWNVAQAALWTYDSSISGKIWNNTVYNSGTCMRDGHSDGSSGTTNNEFKNNLCYANTNNGLEINVNASGTIQSNNLTAGNPNLASVTAGNPNFLKLTASSALAIGQGANLSANFTTDFGGATRTVPWDIGAYEYTATSIPAIALTSPISGSGTQSYSTGSPTLNLAGTSSDSGGTISSVTWACDRCGSGNAANTGVNYSTWTVNNIGLLAGVNVITVTAADNLSGVASIILTVTYAPSFPGNTLAGAWAFDAGSGTSAIDSSGNNNTGTLISGAVWSGAGNGKFNNAITFNGTDGYVNVADANTLDFTQSFTLSAWVFPTSVMTDFRSAIVKNYVYYLYASSSGYCGNGGIFGGFVTNGTSGPSYYVCDSTPLATNQWTHLALTYDGAALRLYRNGVLSQTQTASGYMEPSAGALQISRSQFGEYFPGRVDEVRVRNYAVALTGGANTTPNASCTWADSNSVATASVIGDMNCPVISPLPPTVIKIPATASGLKVGAAASGVKFGAKP